MLVDLRLPDGDGEALLPEVVALRPQPAVAIVSGYMDAERALRLLVQGVWPIPKPLGNIVGLVRQLQARGPAIDRLGAYCRACGLSPKETDLLRAAAEGLRTDEAATRIGCTKHTTTSYWQRIFLKTGQRTQAAVFAAIVRFADAPPCEGQLGR